ncbi:hypothetical protein NL676_003992 [Syzygium grande]|nr:hypothetical protein NL676_003992 [Syzygium grande]
MRFRSVLRASQLRGGAPFVSCKPGASSASRLHSRPKRCLNGLLSESRSTSTESFSGGRAPIGGSSRALRRLYDDYGVLKVPFVFLTNGGGIPESARALELSQHLGVNILPAQVLQGHSPFRNLLNRYENELIVATGRETLL